MATEESTPGVAPPVVDLTMDTSSPPRTASEKENHQPLLPTLADRIKGRSRRSVTSNPKQQVQPTQTQATQTQTTQATAIMKPQRKLPWLLPQDSGVTKRSVEEEATPRPTKRLKVFQDEDTAPRVEAITNAEITGANNDIRPSNDMEGNRDFAHEVIQNLRGKINQPVMCFGDRQTERMHYLLSNAKPANNKEMSFLSGAEAAAKFKPGVFHDGPILTEGQQPLSLQSVEDFLSECYDDNAKVFVQDPSIKIASKKHFAREVKIGTVKKRLLGGKTKGMPWNCLELATHVEDGLRPAFLSGEDTRLLTKIKLEHATGSAGRRSYPKGYKEVEKWALLAESGALTEPHQDSHGYSTYITANQGRIGFGWLSYPTAEERKTWIEDPSSIPGDRFRYVVLKPGQTVFFPAGTVHFVFRLASAGHTLAFGGHVLRCSTILQWVKTMLDEQSSPHVTNEDLTSSAPGYLNRVEKFVLEAGKKGTLWKWGGAEAVNEFLRLKEKFMEKPKPWNDLFDEGSLRCDRVVEGPDLISTISGLMLGSGSKRRVVTCRRRQWNLPLAYEVLK